MPKPMPDDKIQDEDEFAASGKQAGGKLGKDKFSKAQPGNIKPPKSELPRRKPAPRDPKHVKDRNHDVEKQDEFAESPRKRSEKKLNSAIDKAFAKAGAGY